MADFNILDLFNVEENLTDNILWQYDNAPNLKSLIESKQEYYNQNNSEFWQQIITDFLNINTATDWGLNLWGQILQVNRIYILNGKTLTLSTDLYRRLILGKLQLIHSNGTVPEINQYINSIFSNHKTDTTIAGFVKDELDMSVVYVLNFEPTEEELALIYDRDFFPTPAGVEIKVYLLDQKKIFGFYGTGFQPWGQAPFWDGRYIR